jgi:CRP/FNR family transcriptional regulator, cyclic AMP receptor protein
VQGIVDSGLRRAGSGRVFAAPAASGDAAFIDVARRLAERTLELHAGESWTARTVPAAVRDGFVILLVRGLMVRGVRVDGVTADELVFAGDALAPTWRDEGAVCVGETVTWRALEDSTIVVLGDRFLAAAGRQPALAVALCRRQLEQGARVARHAATTRLPRVDRRIVSLLCAVAEERGRMTPDGAVVELPVTHGALGRLVGAKRPTVSLALKSLAEAGLVRQTLDGWVLAPDALTPPAPVAAALAA